MRLASFGTTAIFGSRCLRIIEIAGRVAKFPDLHNVVGEESYQIEVAIEAQLVFNEERRQMLGVVLGVVCPKDLIERRICPSESGYSEGGAAAES